MHNLIDTPDKLILSQEYRRRRLVVIGIFLTANLLIALILLGLVWSIIELKITSSEKLLEVEKALIGQQGEELAREGRRMSRALSAIKPYLKVKPTSDYFTLLLHLRPAGVSFTGISYERDAQHKERIVVNGAADSRKDLVTFIDQLKQEPQFKEVASPLSNVIKEAGGEFTITIQLANPQN